jgi:hypothetical protein
MTGSPFDPWLVLAHVEIAARVQAASTADLDAGRYTLHISPARAVGTLTSRFSVLAAGSGLEHVYRSALRQTLGTGGRNGLVLCLQSLGRLHRETWGDPVQPAGEVPVGLAEYVHQ